MFKEWHLTAMEDAGYMDTNEGCINRVAHYLAKSQNDTIDIDEFSRASYACNVDPNSFTQSDLNKLQKKLNQLT